MRIIRATAARGEAQHKAADETGTATETEAAGDYNTVEEKRTASIVHTIKIQSTDREKSQSAD